MWILFHSEHGYVVDMCGGMPTWSDSPDDAVAFHSERAAWEAIDAAEIPRDGLRALATWE